MDRKMLPGFQFWLEFISARVRESREAAGMTRGQLAEAAGLPEDVIDRIEDRELSPAFVAREKIAGAVGRPVEDFEMPPAVVPVDWTSIGRDDDII